MDGLLHRLAGLDLYRENPVLRYGSALFFVLAALVANFLPIAGQRLPFFFFFAAVALTLASIGIYGVISYATNQRVVEIGIRMALGAVRRDVLKLVIQQGLVLTMIALVLGLGGALVLTHFLTSMLYGIRATDPVTYAAVAALLGSVALVAAFVPARRASRVDPMVALRYE